MDSPFIGSLDKYQYMLIFEPQRQTKRVATCTSSHIGLIYVLTKIRSQYESKIREFLHKIPYATKWLLLFFGSTWSHIYSICSHGDRYCMISPVINLFAKYARNVLHHKLHSIISIYINHEFVIHKIL